MTALSSSSRVLRANALGPVPLQVRGGGRGEGVELPVHGQNFRDAPCEGMAVPVRIGQPAGPYRDGEPPTLAADDGAAAGDRLQSDDANRFVPTGRDDEHLVGVHQLRNIPAAFWPQESHFVLDAPGSREFLQPALLGPFAGDGHAGFFARTVHEGDGLDEVVHALVGDEPPYKEKLPQTAPHILEPEIARIERVRNDTGWNTIRGGDGRARGDIPRGVPEREGEQPGLECAARARSLPPTDVW